MAKFGPMHIVLGGLMVGLLNGAADAEPLALTDTALDSIAAGGVVSSFTSPGESGGSITNSGKITTQIAMPISNAVALCYQCGDNASVIAIANAEALATGTIDLKALADALRPYMKLAPSASPQPRPVKGSGGKR